MKNFIVCAVLVAAGVLVATTFVLSLAARRISLFLMDHNNSVQ